jgi:UDP-glucose:glycoprotein glucosyltransferase
MRTSTLPWRLSTVASLAALLFSTHSQAESSVHVALQPSFSAAPFLVELLETAASENSTAYFPLLDRIAEGVFSDSTTDQDLYNRFIDVLQQDGHLPQPEALSSFKFALSLHAAAPRIEAHFQYYNTSVQPRMMAAQDAACPVWVHFDDKQYCSPTLERAQQPFSIDVDEILPFDHVLGSNDDPPSILYADITHPLFAQFHSTVSQTAKEGRTSYRLRYRPATQGATPLYLSGYGVELNLKRTDYIVIDDRDASEGTDGESEVTEEADNDEELGIKPLTPGALSVLGLNTANYILSSPDPLNALVRVTSDLPQYAHLVSRQNATTDFLVEHQTNREMLLPSGYNVLWVNGLQIEPRRVNAYSLLDHLRRERKLIRQMQEIGLTPPEAVSLLSNEVIAQAQADDTPQRFDWRDEIEGGKVIIWMNDLEQDKRYESWPKELTALFQRSYPGQLPSVARDIHNLIVPIDVSNVKDLELVTMSLQSLVKRTVPVRIGLVPAGSGDASILYTKLSYHIVDTYGLNGLLAFFQAVLRSKKAPSNAEKLFTSSTKERNLRPGKTALAYEEVLVDGKFDQMLTGRNSYVERLQLQGSRPPFIVNGVVMPRGENWFELLSSRVFVDLQSVQQAVYEETLLEDQWVPNFFLFQAVARRNGLVIPPDAKSVQILDVPSLVTEYAEVFSTMPVLPGGDSTLLSDRAHMLLIADLATESGIQLFSAALDFKSSNPDIEILIIHNGASHHTSFVPNELYRYQLQGQKLSADAIAGLKAAILEVDGPNQSMIISDSILDSAWKFWATAQPLCRELGLIGGQSAVWLNGRLVGPIKGTFLAEDFKLLLDYERTSRIAPATTAITAVGLEDMFTKPLDLAKITSVIARSQKSELPEGLRDSMPMIRMERYKKWSDTYTAIKLEPNKVPTIQVVAAVDPASETGQSWIPILRVLSQLDGVNMNIFLNPKTQITELPVKRLYRQVLTAAPTFADDGSLAIPRASFDQVPQDTLFNLGMIVPQSWLVAPKESISDLDNIIFSPGADQDIDATYELEYILIEGHARDATVGPPPRGAQLLLGTEQEPHFTDTIVMANLGYFQFKANPGLWQISLKPGRSSKIFNIDSVGPNGYTARPGDETRSVALMSFQGLTLYPRLSRNTGMEEEDVLEAPPAAGSAMDYISKGASYASSALSSLGFKKSASTSTKADINIFSVASGHLYERMLNIMMLSVMKHTDHTVKFWFIEQFLSPSFKATLPTLASHYGFQYEMVMYKWPHWLRGQREKQREIWGYKILFLDVLFPLDLDKVIFVDADQIVRTDMMELNKVDLQGAPYGFTPMCDSRTEMEGFRFWKQGYWSNYLRGKPYHISALYVVDLKSFRALAAGDRLRQQYQALSADPASLSNLDQDLPNHMQHNLPIHSLSQEWLWCETWCSDESLADAKTIDLCNNPLTKEPKLARARRQVPEWTEYDEDIAGVIRAVKGEEGINEVELEMEVEGGDDKVVGNRGGDERILKKDEL